MTSDIAKKIGNIFTGNNHFVFIKESSRESLVSISVFFTRFRSVISIIVILVVYMNLRGGAEIDSQCISFIQYESYFLVIINRLNDDFLEHERMQTYANECFTVLCKLQSVPLGNNMVGALTSWRFAV